MTRFNLKETKTINEEGIVDGALRRIAVITRQESIPNINRIKLAYYTRAHTVHADGTPTEEAPLSETRASDAFVAIRNHAEYLTRHDARHRRFTYDFASETFIARS